jgi:hypothetical protein
MKIYDAIRKTIWDFPSDPDGVAKIIEVFVDAKDKASFYFSEDVSQPIESIYRAMLKYWEISEELGDVNEDERRKMLREKGELLVQILEFPKILSFLVAPYMQMHTKVP